MVVGRCMTDEAQCGKGKKTKACRADTGAMIAVHGRLGYSHWRDRERHDPYHRQHELEKPGGDLRPSSPAFSTRGRCRAARHCQPRTCQARPSLRHSRSSRSLAPPAGRPPLLTLALLWVLGRVSGNRYPEELLEPTGCPHGEDSSRSLRHSRDPRPLLAVAHVCREALRRVVG